MKRKKIKTFDDMSDRLIENEDGCLEYSMSRKPDGYGWLTYNGKNISAHRLAWILCNGSIPTGMHVLHKCDNPPCCNPSHLFLGTQIDNIKDMVSKGRQGRSTYGARKLTVDQVKSIKHQLGFVTQKRLGEIYGVTQAAIARISTGKNWSWV